jgi:hypothetical protein
MQKTTSCLKKKKINLSIFGTWKFVQVRAKAKETHREN